MTQLIEYGVNDRVWIRRPNNTWWPAKVILVGERTDGHAEVGKGGSAVLTVRLYSGAETPEQVMDISADSGSIALFEASSEKAVTVNKDLQKAISNAESDKGANPLRYEFGTAAAHRRPRGIQPDDNKRASTAGRKRHAESEGWKTLSRKGANGASPLSIEQLSHLKQEIEEGNRAEDEPRVRRILLLLCETAVTPQLLSATSLGQTLNRVLLNKSIRNVHPLVKNVVSSWGCLLPPEYRHYARSGRLRQLGAQRERVSLANNVEGNAAEDNCAAAQREGEGEEEQEAGVKDFSSASVSLTARATNTQADGFKRSQLPFVLQVQRLLVQPGDSHGDMATSGEVEEVARKICADVTVPEDRVSLLEHLRKPGLSDVRRRLVTGELSGKGFLRLSRSELMTQEEKEEQERRITETIRRQEEAELSTLQLTELFQCPVCGKGLCTFAEVQIRSADEPTTKFITCVSCKHNWTEN